MLRIFGIVTVLEVIQKSSEFLSKKGVESPRLQVELLLAHVMKMPRMKLYLAFDRVLKEEEVASLRELIKRRGNREPLQHIIGTTSFCGLDIAVNRNVLIPRPETELLAERGWTFLSQGSSEKPAALDLGTGSGCLAIALAKHCEKAQIHAVDISPEALATARENATRNDVQQRITFHEGDAFGALPKEVKFDLIVSNPPYIPTAEISTLDPEVRDFDPKLALDGGPEGLNFYERISKEAGEFLLPHGQLMCEFGDGQAEAIRRLFEAQKWTVLEIVKDYKQRDRFIIASAQAR